MRRVLRSTWMVVLAALAACGGKAVETGDAMVSEAASATEVRPATTTAGRKITILHVGDTHAHLEAEGPKDSSLDGTLGGLIKAATVIRAARAADPGTLLVHAGDLFQEDVYFGTTMGVAELQLLRGLRLDAMTLGNHEFNFAPATLVEVLGAAFAGGSSPVLTANLDYANSSLQGLQAFVQPSAIQEVNGVRVGLFGLVVPDAAEQFPAPTTDPPAIRSDFAAVARDQVALLRSQGADAVVLLSHLGFDADERIARTVPGLDAIVGGHDHLLKRETVAGPDGNRVLIAHAGEFYRWVGKLTLTVQNHRVILAEEEFIPVDARVRRYAPFAAEVGELQAQANATYGEELFHTPIALALADVVKDAVPGCPQRDSPVGDLIADAMRFRGGTELALTSNGFLTEGLTRGLLVREDAFRIVGDGFDPDAPFGARLGFPLYAIALPGAMLEQLLQDALARGGDYFPQVSGMRVAYDPATMAVDVHVGGATLDPAHVYTITVHVGLLRGLEQLVGAEIPALPLGASEYEAVRDWLLHERVVLYRPQGRILER